MKIYIAGKVRGLKNYKEVFKKAENKLRNKGHITLNPACLPEGMNSEDYMRICIPMLDVADSIYLLDNWRDSEGAKVEKAYAECQNKLVLYDKKVKFYEFNNFSCYALMAVDIDEADPIKVAVNVYKDEIADIEDEDKCVPDEISLEEALEKFKKAQFKKYTDEEKIKQFYETIDLDTDHEQDYAILLVDGCLC